MRKTRTLNRRVLMAATMMEWMTDWLNPGCGFAVCVSGAMARFERGVPTVSTMTRWSVDLTDIGCTDSQDDDESDMPDIRLCDGLDNDGDGVVDCQMMMVPLGAMSARHLWR